MSNGFDFENDDPDEKRYNFSGLDDDLLDVCDVSLVCTLKYGYRSKLEGYNSLHISKYKEELHTLTQWMNNRFHLIDKDRCELDNKIEHKVFDLHDRCNTIQIQIAEIGEQVDRLMRLYRSGAINGR
jgi:hypothetical protein